MPHLNRDQFVELKVAQIAKRTYVILVKDDDGQPTLVVDPGTHLPYKNGNKRVADMFAKMYKGEARTFAEAWDILKKAHPFLEKDLAENHLKNKFKL